MSLHHGGVSVDVHHQTGQKVTFSVYEAEAVVVRADKSEAAAQDERAQQPVVVETPPEVSRFRIQVCGPRCFLSGNVPCRALFHRSLVTVTSSPSSIPSGRETIAPENTQGWWRSNDSSLPRFSLIILFVAISLIYLNRRIYVHAVGIEQK